MYIDRRIKLLGQNLLLDRTQFFNQGSMMVVPIKILNGYMMCGMIAIFSALW